MLSYDGAAVSGPAFESDADITTDLCLIYCMRRETFVRRAAAVKGVPCLPLQLGAPCRSIIFSDAPLLNLNPPKYATQTHRQYWNLSSDIVSSVLPFPWQVPCHICRSQSRLAWP